MWNEAFRRAPREELPTEVALAIPFGAFDIIDHPYVAVPLTGQSRWRSFCTDSTGWLCARVPPDAPELKDGVCPLACLDLR